MNCPACKEPMIVLELNQVEIDYCDNCGGIWLDSGEIELLLNDSPTKDKIFSSLKLSAILKEKKIKCPFCRKKMDKVKIEAGDIVIIDKCKLNEGFWFDKNELQKILSGNLDADNPVIKQIQEMFAYKLK